MTNEQFTVLAQKYIDMVFRVAYNCLGSRSEAEDVVQNCFLKLLQSKTTFQSEAHVRHWLIRVAINECRATLRSPWRQYADISDHSAALSFETPEHGGIYHALMAMPAKYRLPLYLYYYEDYSVEEVSRALGCPVSTAKTRLRRGRELLKKTLKEADSID